VCAGPVRRTLTFSHLVARPWRIPAEQAAGALRNLAHSPGFETVFEAIEDFRWTGPEPRCPITVAWGEKDRVLIYSRQAPRARRRLPSARHVTLTGCGHVPTWDDADPLARRLISRVLENAGMTVVAEVCSGAEAVAPALRHAPDVVLLDRPDAVRALHPYAHIVVLACHEDPDEAVRALAAGASGYLSKDLELDALPRAIAAVTAGEAAVSRRLTSHLIECFREQPQLRPIKSPLTAREWEIVDLLGPERTTVEIADTLVISAETVRTHVKSIMRKLGVHSRHDAPEAAERLRLAAA
jgi:DNA-binding NarL/FixJ family response regulator